MEVLNQVIPIHLVSLIIIIMFLFATLLVLTCLAGISMPAMHYKFIIGCDRVQPKMSSFSTCDLILVNYQFGSQLSQLVSL